MCGASILICVIILGFTYAESQGEADILKRLDFTENLVRELLQEMDALKSQTELQKIQITDMKNQLIVQQQHSNELEALIRTLSGYDQMKSSVDTEKSSLPAHENHSNGASTNRIRRAEIEGPVAFFAKMTNHLEHAGIHQTFIFETVVTNVGNSYHSHLGAFIAPVPGIYVFSTTLVSRHFNSAHAQFVKNGGPITTMYVSSGNSGDETTSQTIVLQMQQGDNITVENLDSDKAFYGGDHSSFSGFLLQEDYSSSAIVGK